MQTLTFLSRRTVRNIVIGLLALLFTAIATVAFMTHQGTMAGSGHFWAFAVEHHTTLMAGMAFAALLLGIAVSQVFYRELERKEKDTQHILSVVMLFLNSDERRIVNYLVENDGETTQAEISRLEHMDRVKAHRSLQKMQDKQILVVVPHGKVRKVILKENILELLRDDQGTQ